MAKQIPTRFTEWEFTEKEKYIATRFSEFNLMLFQTLIAQEAAKRLNLAYDPAKPLDFLQQEAEIKGAIGAYEHLLLLATDTTVPAGVDEKGIADLSRVSSTTQSQSNPTSS